MLVKCWWNQVHVCPWFFYMQLRISVNKLWEWKLCESIHRGNVTSPCRPRSSHERTRITWKNISCLGLLLQFVKRKLNKWLRIFKFWKKHGVNFLLGPIHTQYFCTRYWDKKIKKRHCNKKIKDIFFVKIL